MRVADQSVYVVCSHEWSGRNERAAPSFVFVFVKAVKVKDFSFTEDKCLVKDSYGERHQLGFKVATFQRTLLGPFPVCVISTRCISVKHGADIEVPYCTSTVVSCIAHKKNDRVSRLCVCRLCGVIICTLYMFLLGMLRAPKIMKNERRKWQYWRVKPLLTSCSLNRGARTA